MSQQEWAGWSPLSRRWGPPPWLCDACKRTLPGEAFTNRPHHPLHGESVCDDCGQWGDSGGQATKDPTPATCC
ncbi:Uncharacterised protein [Mycobacteroides abscessus subsp. abscessus]|nr:Uncharacterised protein [Mycobacteroides abscessus subsp. abscessus]